jgi:hypothetical protein
MASTNTTEQAASIGREHGTNAASWVFDGNTPDHAYRDVLQGIEDCDPEVLDAYRVPDLSGEFADDYSEQDLVRDLDLSEGDDEIVSEAANAYLDAASESFWSEVERIAREHITGTRIAALQSAGFPVRYAMRPSDDHPYLSWSDVQDYPADGTEPYVDLTSIGKGEDAAGQASTVDRSNFRRLTEDYPEAFTPTSYANVDTLGAFVADLDEDVTEILVGLRDRYPVYDEEDMTELEEEEITQEWDDFAADEFGRELPEDLQDKWEQLSDEDKRNMFWQACESAGYYPEHSGVEVLWSYAYERAVPGVTEALGK